MSMKFATLASMIGISASAPLPLTKLAFNTMDQAFDECQWKDFECFQTIMKPLWTDNFTYDFVHPYENTYGIVDWLNNEHVAFNEAFANYSTYNTFFAASNASLTCAAYMITRWVGPFAGVPPPPGPAPVVRIRDLDFYAFEGTRISYNWCMVDVVDILQQGGYRVLPEASLPDLGYPAPTGQQGLPAPDSQWVDEEDAAKSMMPFVQMVQEDLGAQSMEARWWAEDMVWYGPAGIGTAKGRTQYVEFVLQPLRAAFTETRVEIEQLVCEGAICGAMVHLWGNHTGTWLGEEPTGKLVRLRFGLLAHVQLQPGAKGFGKLIEGWAQLDIPAAFAMMGVDLLERARKQAANRSSEVLGLPALV